MPFLKGGQFQARSFSTGSFSTPAEVHRSQNVAGDFLLKKVGVSRQLEGPHPAILVGFNGKNGEV